MIGAKQRQLGIKATGTTVSIPNAPMAKLMYYLNTVDSLTDFGIPSHLKDYSSYSNLSFDEENQVLCLAVLLSPDMFTEKGIMINDPRLCPDANNEFYEISDVRTAVAITQEFIIRGKKVHTLKIMAFKTAWIENNYFYPMMSYKNRLEAISEGNVEDLRPRPKQIEYRYSPSPSTNQQPSSRRSIEEYNDHKKHQNANSSYHNDYSYSSYSDYSYSDYSYSSHHHHHHHHHHKQQNSCCIIM
ncbi:hypothetical protein M9Y10_040570 [Tritrichomonas musculus]|uniref:Uncharacterized protein n=1 Tax=Tritrichomonas musculus TaxID=1915356 RepID=A0ABR2GPE8_9EUKA